MMPKPPLDFSKVEALRKHMLLTTLDMSELLGVSRMTYYGWVRGKKIRQSNDQSVRAMLRKLLEIGRAHV
jgi:DNA-binding XRE family transcriptional regulator